VLRELQRIIVATVGAWVITPPALRVFVSRRCLLGVGQRVELEPGSTFRDTNVVISDDVYIGDRCHFDCHDLIVIGPAAQIGAGSSLITGTHHIGQGNARAGTWRSAPIVIGAGSWLGAGVTVLPGVTVGSGCVIAAGAVVTRDCDPDGLYAGVPARRARDLSVAEG
jgi:maltose O-acetyltransferase